MKRAALEQMRAGVLEGALRAVAEGITPDKPTTARALFKAIRIHDVWVAMDDNHYALPKPLADELDRMIEQLNREQFAQATSVWNKTCDTLLARALKAELELERVGREVEAMRQTFNAIRDVCGNNNPLGGNLAVDLVTGKVKS